MADAYNNAITTLNTRANAYLNTNYASSARCVGSVPNNPYAESSQYYTYSLIGHPLKKEDNNYLADYNQMNSLGINNINDYYWLASRIYCFPIPSSKDPVAGCRAMLSNGTLFTPTNTVLHETPTSLMLVSITDSGASWYEAKERTLGLRPVFTLKTNVKIKGDGTSSSPYTLI